MKDFEYIITKEGKTVKGEISAEDLEEAIKEIESKGGEVASVKEKKTQEERTEKQPFWKRSLGGGKVRKQDKIDLYQNITTMLEAGLPVVEALDILKEDAKKGKLKDVIFQMRYDIERGRTLSSSMGKYPDVFPPSDIAMVKAGEVSGNLDVSFKNLHSDLKTEYDFQRKIKGALTYPAVILTVMGIIVTILFIFVLPQLKDLFDQLQVDVPVTTRFMFALSDFIKSYYYILFPGIIGLIIASRVVIRRNYRFRYAVNRYILRAPLFGKYVKYFYVSRFSRMLGLLLVSGVPILESLEIVKTAMTSAPYVKATEELYNKVQRGDKLSEALEDHQDLFPSFVFRMVRVGDSTGTISDSMARIATYYRTQLNQVLGTLTTLLEPIIMLIMGAGVAFIAISVITPIFTITNNISRA